MKLLGESEMRTKIETVIYEALKAYAKEHGEDKVRGVFLSFTNQMRHDLMNDEEKDRVAA